MSGDAESVPVAALSAIEEETTHLISHLIYRVLRPNMRAFSPQPPMPPGDPPIPVSEPERIDGSGSFETIYEGTKRLEGEILAFATRVQSQPLADSDSRRLNQVLSAIREGVQSGKFLKDVRHNPEEFSDSPSRVINSYMEHFNSVMISFYSDLSRLRPHGSGNVSFESLVEVLQRLHVAHDQMHGEIYTDISGGRVQSRQISSLLNVNREILNSCVAMLMSLKDFHLGEEEAQAFTRLPGGT